MIDILLATYNGERYLESQLYSILSQTLKDWRLLIHDDGSSDGTIELINKFVAIDDRIILIDDDIKFGNAGLNFLHLLDLSDADYSIFCDQDDIWLESKLEILLNAMSGDEAQGTYCNAYAYNGSEITADKVSLFERTNLQDSLFLNSGVQGCSLMINRKMRNLLKERPNYIYMHDHYVTIGIIVFGKLLYVDRSLMLYRQHSSNVTGNANVSFLDRVKAFLNSNNPIIDRAHYNANTSFFTHFKGQMTNAQIRLFEEYCNFPSYNVFQKVVTILRHQFKIGRSTFFLAAKVLFKKTIK